MLQYLVQLQATGQEQPFAGSFSHEDVQKLREARPGRPVDLENYIAYRCANGPLSLNKKPDYTVAEVVDYDALCRQLTEAEIEAIEVSTGKR